MKLINNRYKLMDIVGKDVYGSTYIASDISNKNTKVLLKMIDIENKDEGFIDFLTNKFIWISSIRHKYIQKCNSFNVINTIDNRKSIDFQYFYTTEYVNDQLDNYLKLSPKEINDIFIKLCYGLNYLHFRGITYKLLNFKNIMTVKEGENIDYKLREIVNIYHNMENVSSISKYNAQFIAPEIKIGKDGDYSSDIYSLGVVYFYLVSGLDYKKNNFDEIFKKNNNDYLYKIIEKMTAPDPSSRYKNILEVVEDIKKVIPVDYDFFDKEYYERLNFNIPLINRGIERKKTLDLIHGKFLGKSKNNFVFIHGEAGVGKSRFVKEISFQVRMNKINVCSIELNQENNEMFSIYKKILRFIVKNNRIDNNLIDKYGSELVKIYPDLAEMWDVKPSETLTEDKEILRLNNRISNFINEFTAKRPFVVILDNINYAHKNDLNIMEYLVRISKESSLFFLCTYTDEEIYEINDFLLKLRKEINTKFLQLSKLNFEETSSLLKNILGMDHKPLKLTTKIMEETNGNPRYVEEIVKSLFMDKQIMVNLRRVWMADIDDVYNLELPSSIDDAILRSIHSFDDETRTVLDNISIFHSPVSLQTICKIVDLEQNKIIRVLVDLVTLRIINEKFEDWGYSYDYYDNQIKKYIYNSINEDEKKKYHLDAANTLEEFYISEGRDYTVELVHHFTNCRTYDKAIKYCIKAAEKMELLHIYNQALVFYNRAIELLKEYEDINLLIDVLMKMGDIYILTGEIDDAFDIYTRVVKISSGHKLDKYLIDSKNKLAFIYSYRNETDIAKKMLEEVSLLSNQIKYVEGELESGLLHCRLIANSKTHPDLNGLLNKYIKISLNHSMYCYTGEFFNEKGKLSYEAGEISKAQYCFEQSIFFFEKSNNNIKTTSPLNNMGVIHLEGYKDISKAREYYNEALSLFEKYNYITDKGIFLMNIGETYYYEDKYSDAIYYFNKAVDLSIEIGDNTILFASYFHLCVTYLNLCQYDKAYFYLKKLEIEFENYSRRDVYFYDYYLIHINFYTKTHNYPLVYKWYNDFFSAIDNKRVDFDLELKILELKMYNIQSDFHLNKPINIEEIKDFLYENLDKLQLQPVRNFLIDLVYILVEKNEIHHAKYFMDLDEDLIDEFDTNLLRFKRNFILGLFEENRIEYFKDLLNKLEDMELYEFEWKIFKILGDEYYKKEDCFNALSNYITSLDILKNLTFRIPDGLRESYIFGDDIKCIIKERIEDLKDQINGKDNKEYSKITTIKVSRSIENFFEFSDLGSFFRNRDFMKSVYNESREELSMEITELKHLIQNLQRDELYNIQLILKYCSRLCLAERGFVFITDEHNEIQEVINIGSYENTHDVRDVIKSVTNSGKEIVITNQNQFSRKSFKHKEIKSLICIPIKNLDKENFLESNIKHRRKYENKLYSKEIAGYLYLDTKRVFNNFTYETYEKCCLLINLLYVMIQNYDLKKISSIDKLTNVYLRKHIEDLFNKEMLFAKKNELKLSVVMCDIDKFKHINDFYGHRKGDEVLANIGKVLKNNLRKTDLVGRYGGEEFIIILPETDENEAYVACEKLRKVIEDLRMFGNDMTLTMSFGIASFSEHGKSEEELIEKADQALYKSKKSGRNRTTIWNEDIGYDKHRYDKLAGIITGNISTDHRNVNFIIDIIELLKNSSDKSDKLFEVLGYLIEITESKYGAIFEIQDDKIKNVYPRKRASNDWIYDYKFNEDLIREFIAKKDGDFFIDWNDTSNIDSFTGVPIWNSFVVVPLVSSDVQKGILLLSVPINEKEFDFRMFNLVNSLSGIIASML